jgi:hypothetical protein
MAAPSTHEILTATENMAVREMLGNEALMSGLRKIFAFDAKFHAESLENEALSAQPNTHIMIQHSSRCRSAREFVTTIKTRLEGLTVKQR